MCPATKDKDGPGTAYSEDHGKFIKLLFIQDNIQPYIKVTMLLGQICRLRCFQPPKTKMDQEQPTVKIMVSLSSYYLCSYEIEKPIYTQNITVQTMMESYLNKTLTRMNICSLLKVC
jgi:hypothetical protein